MNLIKLNALIWPRIIMFKLPYMKILEMSTRVDA